MFSLSKMLQMLKISEGNKKYGILLASIMFIWSGINKIRFFEKKVNILSKKTGFPIALSSFGMFMVIILEIVGFAILIDYFFNLKKITKVFNNILNLNSKELIQLVLLMVLIFLIVVTPIYHPLDFKHPIPFLSNLTTFGLFFYIYCDI